jgi:hypothetical protein
MTRSLLVGLALALLPVAGSAQQLYRWVDKDGTVRYSDQPPPAGVSSRTLNVPGSAAPAAGNAAPAGAAPSSLEEKEKAFQKRMEEQKKADEKAAAAAKDEQAKAQNCSQARETLATLQSGRRILRTTPQGEQYYVDDAQRATETQQAQKAVQDWCN